MRVIAVTSVLGGSLRSLVDAVLSRRSAMGMTVQYTHWTGHTKGKYRCYDAFAIKASEFGQIRSQSAVLALALNASQHWLVL